VSSSSIRQIDGNPEKKNPLLIGAAAKDSLSGQIM
jgi:hypothetical protein